MNIIKFRDQIKNGDPLFNSALKGRYAYWIHMRYVVPLNTIDLSDYIRYENNIQELIGWKDRHLSKPEVFYWDILGKHQDLQGYVDTSATDEANSINKFTEHNNCASDAELTIDEIKKFRTWLAQRLLSMDCVNDKQVYRMFDENFTEVLQYYAAGMYDNVIRRLSLMGVTTSFNVPGISNCGCGTGTNIASLYGGHAGICDPVSSYKEFMYNEMLKKFCDMDFWESKSDVFLLEFKKYIDNIITLGLPLIKTEYTSNFVDCACSHSDQFVNIDILRRLSQSLSYLVDRDISGHRNFIGKAFTDWAQDLYETMEWK